MTHYDQPPRPSSIRAYDTVNMPARNAGHTLTTESPCCGETSRLSDQDISYIITAREKDGPGVLDSKQSVERICKGCKAKWWIFPYYAESYATWKLMGFTDSPVRTARRLPPR